MTEKDLRIQELETLVAQQQARIAELEAANTSSLQEEIEQLHAIIEAQEEAMADQKKIIANQSTLLDDLSGHLNRNRDLTLSEDIEQEELEASRNSPSMPRTPPGSSQPVLSGLNGGTSYQPRSSRGSGVGVGTRSTAASTQGANRRNPAPAGRGGPAASQSMNTGSHSSLNARSQQREQMTQKLHARAGANTSSTVDHPRAPRPNSAVGRNGATPRARSWTERGGGSAPASSARGPSPTRSPDSTQSSHHSQHSIGMSKKTGGPLPPALPLLRSDA